MEAAVIHPTMESTEPGPPASGLALSFLTAAEKMDIMLAPPTAPATEAIAQDIIARRVDAKQPVREELQTAVQKLVAGRSGGIPKKMPKPARSNPARSTAKNLPRIDGPERFLSAKEVLMAYGYTGSTLPERLPMITCSRATVVSPTHPHANNLLSPPSVCSPHTGSCSAAVCRQPTRVARRWHSEGTLGS